MSSPNPKRATLARLAAALACTPDDLFPSELLVLPDGPAEQADGTWLLPLTGKGGVTRIDAQDVEWAARRPWFRGNGGYVLHNEIVCSRADARETGERRHRTIRLHRALMDVTDDSEVDHINGDPLDNRRSNLRVVTHAENSQNKSLTSYGSSRYRGVSWDRRRGAWRAYAKHAGRHRFLGFFDDEVAAARAAQAFRREHMPFAAREEEI